MVISLKFLRLETYVLCNHVIGYSIAISIVLTSQGHQPCSPSFSKPACSLRNFQINIWGDVLGLGLLSYFISQVLFWGWILPHRVVTLPWFLTGLVFRTYHSTQLSTRLKSCQRRAPDLMVWTNLERKYKKYLKKVNKTKQKP